MRKYESVVSIPTQALPCSGQRVSSQPAPTGAAPLGLQFANRVQRYKIIYNSGCFGDVFFPNYTNHPYPSFVKGGVGVVIPLPKICYMRMMPPMGCSVTFASPFLFTLSCLSTEVGMVSPFFFGSSV